MYDRSNRATVATLMIVFACSGGMAEAQAPSRSAAEVSGVTQAMAEAATAFLESLNAPRLRMAQLEFGDSARVQWEYIPTYREGLPLAEMTGEQRQHAHRLLRTALSGAGYLKVISVMQLEEVLRAIDTSGFSRNAEGYMLAVFGDPGSGASWGWRIEGHHVSLNFTSVRPTELAATPLFLGSNPAEVRAGQWAGLRVLAEEEDLARALLWSLSAEQRARAIYSAEAPGDILTRNDPAARELPVEGLPASEMTGEQRALLLALIDVYAGTVEPPVAAERLAAMREAGVENLRFAWAGGTERGELHYYRVEGPTTLIEYDNVQNGANHIHSVWRDLREDFGGDMLRRHYETSAHH